MARTYKKSNPGLLGLAGIVLLSGTACGVGGHAYERFYDAEADGSNFVRTQASVVQAVEYSEELVVIRPGQPNEIEVARVALDTNGDPEDERTAPVYGLHATLDGRAVLALSGSDRHFGDGPAPRLHYWVDGSGPTAKAYELPAAYGSLRLTPDRRRAILFHGDDADRQNSGLHNANQFTIADLSGAELRVQTGTLDGFGGRLKDVQFPGQKSEGGASPIKIDGVDRDLAVFLADGEITLYDLDDPDRAQVSVRMPSDSNFRPDRTLLRAGDDVFARPVLFVRASESPDVAMLTLVGKAEGEPTGFSAQVSLLTVGAGGTAMATVNDGDTAYLATLRNDTLVFSDIATQQNRELKLESSAEHLEIRTREGAAPEAILWGSGGSAVMVAELSDITRATPRRVEELRIQGGIDHLVWLGPDQAMVSSPPNLYILDFRGDRSVTPLSADVDYNAEATLFGGGQLHIVPEHEQAMYSVDLETLAPSALHLEEPVQASFVFPELGKLMLVHRANAGHVTVVDAAEPSRDTMYSRWGYLLEGLLDQDPPEDEGGEGEERGERG